MSDKNDGQTAQVSENKVSATITAQPEAPAAAPLAQTAASSLDAIEDIDFLLEEIENKIAPLALA